MTCKQRKEGKQLSGRESNAAKVKQVQRPWGGSKIGVFWEGAREVGEEGAEGR